MTINRVKLVPIIFGALGLGILGTLFPAWTNIDDLKSSINEDRITLNELQRSAERSSDLRSRTQEIQEQLDVLNRRLFTPESALTFITTLETTAAGVGITVTVDTFDPPTGKEPTGVLRFSAQGNLAQVLRFLQEAEKLSWLTSIETVSIGLPSGADRTQVSASDTVLLTVSATTTWSSPSNT